MFSLLGLHLRTYCGIRPGFQFKICTGIDSVRELVARWEALLPLSNADWSATDLDRSTGLKDRRDNSAESLLASIHNDKVIAMMKIFCKARLSVASAAMFGTVLLHSGTASAATATISRSVDVKAPAGDVWSLIGPFCGIKDWLPPVAQCIEDGKAPSTRILVTKDGKTAFVETQIARNEAGYSYSYKFLTSPLPVSNYTATIKVTAKANGSSMVTWNGSYTPERGQEKAASDALLGVYDAGLAEIQARFAK